MSKWSFLSVIVCASLVSSSLVGQWTQANGMPTPQGQYPESQYPDNAQAQGQPEPAGVPQDQSAGPDPADLQHGVARFSVAQGDVNIRRGDNGQLTGAVINAPLLAHDHVQTSGGSRAEVQFDAVTMLRLAPNTDIAFADLQYHKAQVQLGLGTIIFRVLQSSPMQVEIDTPSVGVRAVAPGEYRISVFDNGTSEISVRGGQAEILAPNGSEKMNAGRSIMVRGDAAAPELQDVQDVPRDQFDEWSAGRDQEVSATQSTQYLNTDVQGASDLDRYGSWVPSSYGQSWQPQGVAQDWSPYSNGQWSYSDYYGWSWIDYSPWGWAPYHYGRWFNNPGYGWCWYPGARFAPAYYSPALVGFFGFGGGVGIGFGGLGWVALAPFESFHRWWGIGGGFGSRGGAYGLGSFRNAGFRGGVLAVSVNNFGGIHQRFNVATRSQIMSANVIKGRLPVSNIRAGMNYSPRVAVANNRFAAVQSRSFYNSSAPGRSVAGGGRSAGAGFAASRTGSAVRTTAPAAGWHNFGNMGTTAAPHSNFQGSESSGWHNFGNPISGSAGSTARSYSSTPRTPAPAAQQPRSYSSQPGNSQPGNSQPGHSQPSYNSQPSYRATPRLNNQPSYSSAPRSYSQPSYQQQPRSNYSAPRQTYSAPRQSAPSQRSAPAPRSTGGGGHSSGGGGGHSSGGGGGHHGR